MNTIRICPICGNPLPPDAPAGLCPVCLLKTNPEANPAPKAKSGEPASTITISPDAFVRVRYFGDYELQEEIARGGMGVVWKVRQVSLKREPIQAVHPSAVRKAEGWLRQHPWTLIAAASLVVMLLAGLLYWQYERVKFLENRPLLTDDAVRHPDLRSQQLKTWNAVAPVVYFITVCAFSAFQRYQAKGLKRDSLRLTGWGPYISVSQGLRVVCGLIGVMALGFTVLYFAKTIQVSVWENKQGVFKWLLVYVGSVPKVAFL